MEKMGRERARLLGIFGHAVEQGRSANERVAWTWVARGKHGWFFVARAETFEIRRVDERGLRGSKDLVFLFDTAEEREALRRRVKITGLFLNYTGGKFGDALNGTGMGLEERGEVFLENGF
jgi:hypothetical protein